MGLIKRLFVLALAATLLVAPSIAFAQAFSYGSKLYYGQVSCGSTPTLLMPNLGYSVARSLVNAGSTTVYLGDASVTSSTGTPFPQGGFSVSLFRGDIYCITVTGSETVGWLQY